MATATITNILLFLLLQTYGQWVVTAVTREKASRVVEVLLAVIRPRQLLVGKVIGIGTVALVHAAVLIAVALVTTRVMDVDIASGIAVGDLLLAAAWFVLGYALYCSAYAAAGSLVSRVEDAQTVAFPIMLPLLFGYIVSFSVADGANTLVWVLAFIPPTAVVAMPTLYAVGEAPLWAVGVSMALTVAAIVAVGLLAARIYERSVLHAGRKLSWREALRRPERDRGRRRRHRRLTAAARPPGRPGRGLAVRRRRPTPARGGRAAAGCAAAARRAGRRRCRCTSDSSRPVRLRRTTDVQ